MNYLNEVSMMFIWTEDIDVKSSINISIKQSLVCSKNFNVNVSDNWELCVIENYVL